jgi:uncharacterized protein
MIKVGNIVEIWRYPVSSLGGEQCGTSAIELAGLTGDRQYTLFDRETGTAASPEKDVKWRPALFLSSSVCGGTTRIHFPDGRKIRVDSPNLNQALSAHFGFDVAIGGNDQKNSEDFGLPLVKNRYNLAPLHIVTTSSLSKLTEISPGSTIDRRRFRPNVLIETDGGADFVETQWIGVTLRLGEVLSNVFESTKRCGMTLVGQPSLPEQAEILRSIVRHNQRNLGVYGDVILPGEIKVGDDVCVISATKNLPP